eukprot:CAMPEP_0204209538 /NCGR_PEP_ID=MMETSP0361-20130328/73273_1 /ASSEMBLY_ACC=CAM_ASM_000343 /TAXON_ID=268821 /ORGANISM="Scrippsiella Hangoei, Strain SHTV-5" /LENGTH=344 /DNA_ID=CAMNT_0051173513 /DNA_START=59 /DNA_END=1092 /DNA_ORIENTATION=-
MLFAVPTATSSHPGGMKGGHAGLNTHLANSRSGSDVGEDQLPVVASRDQEIRVLVRERQRSHCAAVHPRKPADVPLNTDVPNLQIAASVARRETVRAKHGVPQACDGNRTVLAMAQTGQRRGSGAGVEGLKDHVAARAARGHGPAVPRHSRGGGRDAVAVRSPHDGHRAPAGRGVQQAQAAVAAGGGGVGRTLLGQTAHTQVRNAGPSGQGYLALKEQLSSLLAEAAAASEGQGHEGDSVPDARAPGDAQRNALAEAVPVEGDGRASLEVHVQQHRRQCGAAPSCRRRRPPCASREGAAREAAEVLVAGGEEQRAAGRGEHRGLRESAPQSMAAPPCDGPKRTL